MAEKIYPMLKYDSYRRHLQNPSLTSMDELKNISTMSKDERDILNGKIHCRITGYFLEHGYDLKRQDFDKIQDHVDTLISQRDDVLCKRLSSQKQDALLRIRKKDIMRCLMGVDPIYGIGFITDAYNKIRKEEALEVENDRTDFTPVNSDIEGEVLSEKRLKKFKKFKFYKDAEEWNCYGGTSIEVRNLLEYK